jgi:hypothetical protein
MQQLNLIDQNAMSVANTEREFMITISERFLIFRFSKTELQWQLNEIKQSIEWT